MSLIGESLRKARLEKGLSLEVIEKDTKIRRRYLEALENEHWDVIPGRVYLRGFLKTYSRYLGLDDVSLLAALNDVITHQEMPEKEPHLQKIDLPTRPPRRLGMILGLLAIALLLGSQYLYEHYFTAKPSVINTPGVKPPEVNTPGENNPNNSPNNENPSPSNGDSQLPPPLQEDINLTLTIVDATCWVQVKDDKNIIFEGTMKKGEEKSFTAKNKITFILGNAGVVNVKINSSQLGILGNKGKVINKTYILEDNELKEIKV
ncbi:MAG: helix-turn-helix domain-containing protein [Bacillota bacterium]|uniref:DUF4115 domain-containing protein n=1 Tax=Thermanaerosceptrum fracticalcis TaxID=1712410 RepID=A0A7G6E0V0_THEFR|nr:helix-turn-helix domain-containing protein [Thermanaerosceptrum fracticalcis]QNB45704.1 DUF4115 domain-containing protein [Thermanaerosceptrum fracticalcis]